MPKLTDEQARVLREFQSGVDRDLVAPLPLALLVVLEELDYIRYEPKMELTDKAIRALQEHEEGRNANR